MPWLDYEQSLVFCLRDSRVGERARVLSHSTVLEKKWGTARSLCLGSLLFVAGWQLSSVDNNAVAAGKVGLVPLLEFHKHTALY